MTTEITKKFELILKNAFPIKAGGEWIQWHEISEHDVTDLIYAMQIIYDAGIERGKEIETEANRFSNFDNQSKVH